MKVLFSWLKEFVPLDISAEQAADVLARLGFEISGVERLGGHLNGVVTAEVRDVQKHPNADRLSLCKVFDGQQEFSVVCGAPNVRAHIRVPLARIGATLPDGMKIAAAKLRGVDSQGMICSSSELGLTASSEGILILDDATPLGVDIRSILHLDDTIIEIEIPPNRRDVISVIGVAREIAAALNIPLKNPEPRVRELELSNSIALSNEAPELCPRYIARLVREVRVAPSPEWMVRRLTRCGIRSINNIVDITNYVMLELGQPLHAFDAMTFRGRRIRVRTANEGESLLTLEGKVVQLDPSILVIADEEKPAAIAGIIGGEPSSITANTMEIILESAAFSAASIRQTSRKLGISTDSSYRFERGSDWNLVALASARAAQLILELAGGMGFKAIQAAPRPPVPTAIKLQTELVRKRLGLEFKEAVIADLLRRLGCVISMGSGQLLVTIPSWRTDLTNASDLLEEIARLHGYDNIPTRPLNIRWTAVPDDSVWSFEHRLISILVGLGASEAQNFSFLNTKQIAYFTPGFGRPPEAQPIALSNPLSQEQALMRTSLLPGLLENALTNFHHQVMGVQLFELGRIFDQTPDGVKEIRRLGFVMAGEISGQNWRQKTRKADFYELAGVLDAFLQALQIPGVIKLPGAHASLHPKRAATLVSGSTTLGWIGEIHPDLAAQLDCKEPLVGAELDIVAMMQAIPSTVTVKEPSAFPPVHRDLSVVVDEKTPYATLQKTLQTAAGLILEGCVLIDLYRGASIGEQKKSMTLSLVFRHAGRTLQDSEVEESMERIKSVLLEKCEAKIRQ